jgi:glycosyltransferase EpsE
MSPKITVLMSVFNDERFLRESIESILFQSFKNFEFIVIDDASSDGSLEILEEYERKDSRIRLVKNKVNKGLSYNLAAGLSMASGKWVARMDADDISVKERLSTQMLFIQNNPDVDIVGSYVIDIDENGNDIELRKVPTSHEKISKLIWTCPFIHPTVLIRKEAIIRAGSYNKNLRRRQDYDLWFRCHKFNLIFANINKPLLYYRSTDDYYKKNNMKVQLQQALLGYRGAKSIKASPIAYIGISVAFIKGVLPYKVRKPLNNFLKIVDPRRK